MFKNLKIGMRLGVGFGLMVLCLIFISVASYIKLTDLNNRIDNLAFNRAPVSLWSSEMSSLVYQAVLIIRDGLAAETDAEAEKVFEEINPVSARITELVDLLSSTISSDGGKKRLAEIVQAREAFLSDFRQVRKMIGQADEHQVRVFIDSELNVSQEKYVRILKDMVSYQESSMSVSGKEAATAAAQGLTMIIIIAVVCFIIICLLLVSLIIISASMRTMVICL